MSATNRGSERSPKDFYKTPMYSINSFLDNYKIRKGNILEPCAGDGNIIKAIRQKGYYDHITAVEIREEEKQVLKNNGASETYIEDFLDFKPTREFKTIITNPPFSLAIPILKKCFEIASEDTDIIMLLRVPFLESKERYEFWQEHPVNDLYVLAKRPSFTNGGSDATAYGFFVWNNSGKQSIRVIRGE